LLKYPLASFKPKYIIPGHGSASGLSLATNNTYHYLVFLKTKISKILENNNITCGMRCPKMIQL
jgi:hypothetical protein